MNRGRTLIEKATEHCHLRSSVGAAVLRDVALRPSQDLRSAIRMFDLSEADYLAVVDDEKIVLGTLSERFVHRRYTDEVEKRSARCSVSSEQPKASGRRRRVALLAGLIAAAVLGAVGSRLLFSGQPPLPQRQTRPIVQIVRQQSGLPDVSDMVDRLCPWVAVVVPRGADAPMAGSGSASAPPASLISGDGWLLVSGSTLPSGQLDAIFGDGRRTPLSEVRQDPVSGLAIVKADSATELPLSFNDQAFPRVGQFGLALSTPVGNGCSATAAMIGSDFLADGGGPSGYVRLQPLPDPWAGGMPLLGTDGRVIGIGADDPAGTVIPSPVVSAIVDELVRNSLSPSTSYGFRVIDYQAQLAAQLGNLRSGAGIALVEPKSAAARAGLQAGDIVTAVDDVPVSGASELSRALDAQSDAATLSIQRNAQQLKLTIKRAQ